MTVRNYHLDPYDPEQVMLYLRAGGKLMKYVVRCEEIEDHQETYEHLSGQRLLDAFEASREAIERERRGRFAPYGSL